MYRNTIRVRYGEVDMQRVVFNSHYLTYCDDTVDTWLRSLFSDFETLGWDIMLKKATIEWQSGARLQEQLDIDVAIARWGDTSFDIGVRAVVGERAVFTATLVYVGVRPGTLEPVAPPAVVRAALGEATAW
ncbi:MAG: thioesterase family protein [Acidimicrobiales bacterium]